SERTAIQARDQRVDQITQARFDVPGVIDAPRQPCLPFNDCRTVAQQLYRVQDYAKHVLLRFHQLPGSWWRSLYGQFGKSWHCWSPWVVTAHAATILPHNLLARYAGVRSDPFHLYRGLPAPYLCGQNAYRNALRVSVMAGNKLSLR